MEIGADPMARLRAQVCAQPVAARGGPAVVAELATLLRMAVVPPVPTARDVRSAAVHLDLPDVAVVRRVSRLASALGVPVRGVQVVGAVPRQGGRSRVTGSTIRPQRWLRLRLQLGAVTARLGLFGADGRLAPGLPPAVLAGGRATAAAGWRAALLARGEWAPELCPPVLGMVCPTDGMAADLGTLARVLRLQVVVRALDRGSLLRVGPAGNGEGSRTRSGAVDGAMAAACTDEVAGVDTDGHDDDVQRLLTVVGAGPAAASRRHTRPGLSG